ncbi:MAG: response regulator [Thermoanaerobaculia bacterium]
MRLLIADDHALFRQSLSSLLVARGHEVVGHASDGREAVRLAHELRPEVVLMDLSMPNFDGLAATRLIAADLPEIRVVILTASDDDQKLFDAIKSGAQGFILKNIDADAFFAQLEGVVHGEPALSPGLARRLMREFSGPREKSSGDPDALTDRETDVLTCLVDGVTSNRDLSVRLNVSENTIKFHMRNILDKLHLGNRAQVVAYALRHRLVDPPVGDR